MKHSKNNPLKFMVTTMISLSLGLILVGFAYAYKDYHSTSEYDMHGPISMESAEEFRKALQKSESGDTVNMHIESWGGLVLSKEKIIYLMKSKGVRFNCVVDSHAASAAAMILMQCDKITAAPKAMIIFHMYQVCEEQSVVGCLKMRPVSFKTEPLAYLASVADLAQIMYILTDDEWDRMLEGEDILIEGEALMERLERLGVKQ